MTTGFDAANLIPGDDVTNPLADLQVTMWADPGFAVVGICADAGLGCVFNSTLNFAAAKPKANRG